jgi:hypothetical protein
MLGRYSRISDFFMLGNFQHSQLRIEVGAASSTIRQQLTTPARLRQLLFPMQFVFQGEDLLRADAVFTSTWGPIRVEHRVDWVGEQGIRLILNTGIDGYQEWCWGDGWVQSRLEGISLLPLNLIQTANLLRLRGALAI